MSKIYKIKQKEYISSELHKNFLLLSGMLYKDTFLCSSDKQIIPAITSNNIIGCVDSNSLEEYAQKQIPLKEHIVQLNGMLTDFFGQTKLELSLPTFDIWVDGGAKKKNRYKLPDKIPEGQYKINYNNLKNIKLYFRNYYVSQLAMLGEIDDLMYNIIVSILKELDMVYIAGQGVGFANILNKPNKKEEIKVNIITPKEMVDIEIEQGFTNEIIGDANLEFAYTHLLREHANYKLFNWSKTFLSNWKKYNILATSRNQGKTNLAAFIAVRELLNNKPGYGGRKYREIKYFGPDKDNIGATFFNYLKNFIGDMKHVLLPNGEKAFKINDSRLEVICNITGNSLKCISLYNVGVNKELGTHVGEGILCDIAIIDEATRIINDFWTSFHQRAINETNTFYICSTINEETPRNHFMYNLLIEGESGSEHINSMRVNIEMNELAMSQHGDKFKEHLEQTKDELMNKSDKEFYAKGYCVILDDSKVFYIDKCLRDNKLLTDGGVNDIRILGFDLGKLEDSCGITIINLTNKCIEVSETHNHTKYGDQLKLVKEYKKNYPNLYVIGDRSGVGEAVSEMDIENIVDTWIKTSGNTEGVKYNKTHGYWVYSKGGVITGLASLFYTKTLVIPTQLTELIGQLHSFKKSKSGRSNIILYSGGGKKTDDLVLSCAYAGFYMSIVLGLKTSEDISRFCQNTGNSNLYDVSYTGNNNESMSYYNGLY